MQYEVSLAENCYTNIRNVLYFLFWWKNVLPNSILTNNGIRIMYVKRVQRDQASKSQSQSHLSYLVILVIQPNSSD